MSYNFILLFLLFTTITISCYKESYVLKFILEDLLHKINPSISINIQDLDGLINSSDSGCEGRLVQLFKKNINDPLFRPFIENSGKGLNLYGNFPACQKAENMTYFVLSFMAPPYPLPIGSLGTCLPSICNSETLINVLQKHLDKIISFYSLQKIVVSAVD